VELERKVASLFPDQDRAEMFHGRRKIERFIGRKSRREPELAECRGCIIHDRGGGGEEGEEGGGGGGGLRGRGRGKCRSRGINCCRHLRARGINSARKSHPGCLRCFPHPTPPPPSPPLDMCTCKIQRTYGAGKLFAPAWDIPSSPRGGGGEREREREREAGTWNAEPTPRDN